MDGRWSAVRRWWIVYTRSNRARIGRGYGYFSRGVFGGFGVNGSIGVGLIRIGEYRESDSEGERPNISLWVGVLDCYGYETNVRRYFQALLTKHVA